MTRSLALPLVLLSGTAYAQEYYSEPAEVVFDGRGVVVDAEYQLPFGTTLDVIIAEFWIGVTVKLTGDAEFALYVEGQSDISWSTDDNLPGLLYHTLTPLAGSGLAALKTSVGFTITFDLWEGNYGSGSRILSFPLVAQDVVFDLKGTPFTPFMLPGQSPSSQTIRTTSDDLAFQVPLTIPIGLGDIAQIKIGTILTGYPATTAIFTGESLVTRTEDQIVQQGGGIEMYEPAPEIELISEYAARVVTNIGYVFKVDLFFEIDILGFFKFPITIPLFNQTFPLFSDDVAVPFPTERYTHPLPMIVPTYPSIDFGEIAVGEEIDFTYLINNDGYLELEGLVGVEGDPVFAATPPEFFAVDGGQSSVVVTFTPDRVGEFYAELVLLSNDPYNEYYAIPITGTGVAPSDNNNGGFDDDNPYQPGGSTIYSTCGCAAGAWTPAGLAPLFLAVPLLAIRRRRRA